MRSSRALPLFHRARVWRSIERASRSRVRSTIDNQEYIMPLGRRRPADEEFTATKAKALGI